MLKVQNYENREASDEALRAMWAARKSVFVDLLKWDLPVLAGQYELDQFDNPHARYIILSGPDNEHYASARLLPTTRPHILDSFYAAFCEAGVPRGPTIREITRFCLDRSLRASERREARDALICTLVDHALMNGITAYTAIASEGWFRQVLEFGWDCRPLGPPRYAGKEVLAAIRIDIDRDTPQKLAAAGITTNHRGSGRGAD
ncbi:acyl-homoserine lactone synthase [Novosphingobium sp. PhB165]|uniref:acyl-homoserine-lactone synthase n=1 Tax=Novosphingobium sp. PhB165 TaxID=2485105 RepID=UPI00104DB703|nr:acyl-homoserine-lactone synthase [Novosphingobium sp. PhB165]TCM13006.1 acyl-homoserine lactone synthase [Novosphingobium sp. PhB165]